MKTIEIEIVKDQRRETATIKVDRKTRTLTFSMKGGATSSHTAEDLYVCLGSIRADFPEVTFLCKGAKLNVHPSRMTSQMACGLVAYELKIGYATEEENTVRIFDYEENDLTNNIEDQKSFYNLWLKSVTA